jgi:hypothetical protein
VQQISLGSFDPAERSHHAADEQACHCAGLGAAAVWSLSAARTQESTTTAHGKSKPRAGISGARWIASGARSPILASENDGIDDSGF